MEILKEIRDIEDELYKKRILKLEAVNERDFELAADYRDEEKKLQSALEKLVKIFESTLSDLSLIEKAKIYATKSHDDVNHKYNDWPYTYHLEMVVEYAKKYIKYIPNDMIENVLSACWCHDVIEDTRKTYNDVKTVLNEKIADLVYALTNEKGRNRKEKANDKYYQGIIDEPYADFIKICDRMANIKASGKYKMMSMYAKEHDHFKKMLYVIGRYEDMWAEMEEMIN